MPTVSQEIEERLRAYWDTFEALKFDQLLKFWDTDEAQPLWFPEEEDRPMTDWDAIGRYVKSLGAFILLNETNISEFEHRALAPDVCSVLFRVRWYCLFTGVDKPVAGFTHHAAVLRRRGGVWRFVQYHEEPRSPVLYLRRVRQLAVDPVFAAKAEKLVQARAR